MHAFTEKLALRIERPEARAIADSLTDAGEMMRMWCFFGGDPSGSAVVGPFSEPTNYPLVRADDVERLKEALMVFVQRHPRHPQLSGAIHGLSYMADSGTKPLLIKILRDCVGRDSASLYQTILALEALGDNLYGPRSHTSIEEVERNERVALDYLSSQCPT